MVSGTTGRDALGQRTRNGQHLNRLDKEAERRDAAADLRKLTKMIIEDMQHGMENRLMDPKEMRLLGGTAIRAIRLYLKTLEEGSNQKDRTMIPPNQTVTDREDQTPTGKE
jgi:hypothetical protein